MSDDEGPAGLKTNKGLNENLGRELMELHTLGVAAKYTQGDVTSAAKILTGWGVAGRKEPEAWRAKYYPQRHEPGEHEVAGIVFPDDGATQLDALLDALAVHPATARHIAAKLVAAFVADTSPPPLVDKVEHTFQETKGDLRATAKALVTNELSWRQPPVKTISPYDMIVATARALGSIPPPAYVASTLNVFGTPLWGPIQPSGFSTADDAWSAPSLLVERLDWTEREVRRAKFAGDPRELADSLFGKSLSAETQQAIARAETREQGLTLLMMSPELQLR